MQTSWATGSMGSILGSWQSRADLGVLRFPEPFLRFKASSFLRQPFHKAKVLTKPVVCGFCFVLFFPAVIYFLEEIWHSAKGQKQTAAGASVLPGHLLHSGPPPLPPHAPRTELPGSSRPVSSFQRRCCFNTSARLAT